MSVTAKEIDAILPQTQCGLCGFKGCMPYAEALAKETAEINLCPPGGVQGLIAIAKITGKDAQPFVVDMEKKAKPTLLAVIREAECIGCTKCIQACPVDAILGSAKAMHTVIKDECTGCELCVSPCPVDCIDMIEITDTLVSTEKKNHYRNRFLQREERLKKEKESGRTFVQPDKKIDDKKAYIQAALLRVKTKK